MGLSDVASVASLSDDHKTGILGLITAGNISVLDAFRSYIYEAEVTASGEGISVSADREEKFGQQEIDCIQWKCGRICRSSIKRKRKEL